MKPWTWPWIETLNLTLNWNLKPYPEFNLKLKTLNMKLNQIFFMFWTKSRLFHLNLYPESKPDLDLSAVLNLTQNLNLTLNSNLKLNPNLNLNNKHLKRKTLPSKIGQIMLNVATIHFKTRMKEKRRRCLGVRRKEILRCFGGSTPGFKTLKEDEWATI